MWDLLSTFKDQVTKYSTFFGQLWYLCVFLFRLIVVVTIGDGVYGGELGEFDCSTSEPGCTTMCFNEFIKISHIRFWSFQLLAVATPTVLFHFYSLSVTGNIRLVEEERKAAAKKMNDMQSVYTSATPRSNEGEEGDKEVRKLKRREKKIGHVKIKKVFTGSELQEVAYTNSIHIAYAINVVLRLAIEGVFIFLGYHLFKVMDRARIEEITPIDFILFRVPAFFKCEGTSPAVTKACSQAIGLGGAVPCWVSRPWEKTILVRYMNIMSSICFVLSAFELIYLAVKGYLGYIKQADKRVMRRRGRKNQGGSNNGSQYYHTSRQTLPNYYSTMNAAEPAYGYEIHAVPQNEHIPMAVMNDDAMSSVTGHIQRVNVPPSAAGSQMYPAILEKGGDFDRLGPAESVRYLAPTVLSSDMNIRPHAPGSHYGPR